MAYLPYDDANGLKRYPVGAAAAPAPYLPPGDPTSSAAGGASGGGSAVGQTAAPQPDTGSGWMNLQSYLAPNMDQAKAFGQQVGSAVGADVSSAQKAASDQASAWQGTNQKALDDWSAKNKSDYDQYMKTQGQNATAAWGKGQTYTAPGFASSAQPGLTAWSPDTSGVTKAQQEVDALGSGAGQQAYLQQQYGKGGGYTQGQNGLDAFLLGAGGGLPGSYGSLSGLSNPAQPGIRSEGKQPSAAGGVMYQSKPAPPVHAAAPEPAPAPYLGDPNHSPGPDYVWSPDTQTWRKTVQGPGGDVTFQYGQDSGGGGGA